MTDRAHFIKTVSDLGSLSSMWLMAKTAEATATADRRNIEDRIRELTGVRDDVEGTENVRAIGYKVKMDMPMLKGPVVDELYKRGARWLAGGALER
jgi:hypothetical protein